MAITITITLDNLTVQRLSEIAEYGKKSETIRRLISNEWLRLYKDGETILAGEPEPAEAIAG
jgi:hypothetical protein